MITTQTAVSLSMLSIVKILLYQLLILQQNSISLCKWWIFSMSKTEYWSISIPFVIFKLVFFCIIFPCSHIWVVQGIMQSARAHKKLLTQEFLPAHFWWQALLIWMLCSKYGHLIYWQSIYRWHIFHNQKIHVRVQHDSYFEMLSVYAAVKIL